MCNHRSHPAHCCQGIGFDNLPVALFQLVLQRLPLGEINNRTEHHGSFAGLNRVEADVYRKNMSVPVFTVQLQTRTHRPGGRIVGVTTAQSSMGLAGFVRYQYLQRLTAHFLAGVAKHLLGSRISQCDDALRVDQNHCAGSCFDCQVKVLF